MVRRDIICQVFQEANCDHREHFLITLIALLLRWRHLRVESFVYQMEGNDAIRKGLKTTLLDK